MTLVVAVSVESLIPNVVQAPVPPVPPVPPVFVLPVQSSNWF